MAGLFLAVCNSLGDAEAAASPVVMMSDISSADVMVDDDTGSYFVEAQLTLSSTDITYRKMEAHMIAVWPSGVAWTTYFLDEDYNELANNTVEIHKAGVTVVKLVVVCDGVCSAGDTNTVQVVAKTDPVWYHNGNNASDENNTSNENNTCGSSDCETDTSPASASSNVTNTITISLTARAAYGSAVACDAAASTGDNKVYPGNATLWRYTLENVGWNTDTYQFTGQITNADGHDVSLWSITPGMADGKELTGQSNSSSYAVHIAAGSISIIPATDATPGIYNVELTVTPTDGASDSGCNFDVVVPELETEEETTADPANETAEKETEEEIEEAPREVPSVSLIPALLSIGLIAISRRK